MANRLLIQVQAKAKSVSRIRKVALVSILEKRKRKKEECDSAQNVLQTFFLFLSATRSVIIETAKC